VTLRTVPFELLARETLSRRRLQLVSHSCRLAAGVNGVNRRVSRRADVGPSSTQHPPISIWAILYSASRATLISGPKHRADWSPAESKLWWIPYTLARAVGRTKRTRTGRQTRAELAGLKVGTEELLAAVLENAAQPICVVDTEGWVRLANRAALAALGYDRSATGPMRLPPATGKTVASELAWFARRDGSTFPASYVSVPIEMAGGRLAIVTFADAEDRLHEERLRRENETILAAQRRIATLVAGGAPSAEVFAAIAEQVGDVIGLPLVVIWRYEPDGMGAVISAWGELQHPFQPGSRWALDGDAVCALLRRTGRPGRIDDFAEACGTIADAQRTAGMRACAGAPIIVGGEVWGAISVLSRDPAPLPAEIEYRLAGITELVATAISSSASREQLARLADEQAALRRVATLVARGVSPPDLFAAVAREVGLLLGVDATYLYRYDSGGTATGVASWTPAGLNIPVGTRVTLEGDSVVGIVSRTGRPARMDGYELAAGAAGEFVRGIGLGSSVGAPVVVDQRLWGVLIVSLKQDGRTLPPDTESRVAAFTELIATAISNTESRSEVARLAEEQAALRRVATLVARGVPEGELFNAVIEEVGRLFGSDLAEMIRYDADLTVIAVAAWPAAHDHPWSTKDVGPANLIAKARRPVRFDWSDVSGTTAALFRAVGIRSSIASPILVGGHPWGALVVHTRRAHPFPPDAESRLKNFTELVATAISNIEARAELGASRARIVEAADEERRRVVRDLHDGAQQRLVHTIVTLKLGLRALENGEADVRAVMTEALGHAQHATEELRELTRGILPAGLTHGGLRSAVNELASLMPVPVENRVSVGRFPATIEATAYFVVAEALTNVAKHSHARHATVTAGVDDHTLRVQIRDDGIGGARPEGTGLIGMADRLAAVGGEFRIESPAGGGTLIVADFPLPA
jgi:signal transduction histidine kinase